ncbi:hypothetical protein HPB48_010797 [Haemaphysalis longicornis]|uniref:Hydroxysteroid 17-beta dehydrogenase 11 n=1 Tax=Haemaphysalis longicornis TaxID=44386 RepID=A0A9J6H056_HAELO|nr:hypothetical protein HPB48_010797 [Haemaphysalis longicornis]
MEVVPYFMLFIELLGVTGRCLVSVLVYLVRLAVPGNRKSLRDKHVLVTGAGHGLGREIALRCAELGAKLILLDINKVSRVACLVRARGVPDFRQSSLLTALRLILFTLNLV